MEISLPAGSNEPLYMQLYHHIRSLIQQEEWKDGAKLPSVRSMHVLLNISKITIETAYQMLLAEGYIVSKPRSGYYVVNPPSLQPGATGAGKEADSPPNTRQSVRTKSILPGKPISIHFDPAAVDADSFPIRNWKSALGEALSTYCDSLHQYGDPQGEYEFRSTLAQYLKHSRGVTCSPEQIVIGSSIQYSIGVLAQLLKGVPSIAFEEPGYAPVREAFKLNGYSILPIPVQDKGLSVAELEKTDAQVVYVTPSHQFPTGGTLPYSARQQLLQWAYERNAYIIEDDYDGEFRYSGRPIPSLQGTDRQGAVIYIGTFSKVFSPALRMNYMVLPAPLARQLPSIAHALSGPSRIEQIAMQLFMERGHWYRHIRRMRNLYRKKHERLIELIHKHFSTHVQIMGQNAGLHIELMVHCDCSVNKLVRLAALSGVRVSGFQQMWSAKPTTGKPRIYLGFAGVRMSDMERGIVLLRQAWAAHLRSF